ncbi:cupin domain-containing protein [Streptomyces sp. NPDC048275]|uniref:cupin domain-containing protein n=1 Tax=Streptomyces sp. NPDC048275 TaxID=3155629 RepID=UPI0033ED90F3
MSDEAKPVHVPADGGTAVFLDGQTYTTLLSKAQSNGEFSLVDCVIPDGAGTPSHLHHNESETFFVLEGEIVIVVGGEEHVLQPGGLVYVPKNTRHNFVNRSGKPARMLALYAPGGMDGLFTDVGEPGTRGVLAPPKPLNLELLARMAPKYGYSLAAE